MVAEVLELGMGMSLVTSFAGMMWRNHMDGNILPYRRREKSCLSKIFLSSKVVLLEPSSHGASLDLLKMKVEEHWNLHQNHRLRLMVQAASCFQLMEFSFFLLASVVA